MKSRPRSYGVIFMTNVRQDVPKGSVVRPDQVQDGFQLPSLTAAKPLAPCPMKAGDVVLMCRETGVHGKHYLVVYRNGSRGLELVANGSEEGTDVPDVTAELPKDQGGVHKQLAQMIDDLPAVINNLMDAENPSGENADRLLA